MTLGKRLSRLLAPSLLVRAALALALVGLLPMAVITHRLIGINENAMDEQVDSTHTLAARTAAERVDAFLATRIALAHGLATNPAMAEPLSPEARVLLSENLQAWVGLGVLAIAVVDQGGETVILAQVADEEEKRRAAAALALPADLEIGLVAAGPGDAHPTVRLAVPLLATDARLWLVAGEPPDPRDGLVAALETAELGEEAELVLAHRERGTVLAGPPIELPPLLVEDARSGRFQGTRPGLDPAAAGEEMIGAHAPVGNAPWTVFSLQPSRVARRVARRMSQEAGLAVGLASLLVAVLSAAAWATVVRPIRQLASAQRRLAGGVRTRARSGSEIDQLKASFEALEQRLKDRQALDQVFLGRYQILEVVGSGAMGTVFKGRDPKLQRPVALKTIRLDAKIGRERRAELISRLLQEAVTVAKFNHPNIVAVYDVEDRPEAAFVAMEFVDGVSLERLLWSSGRLPAPQVMPLGAGIAAGLAAAHEHGLVHRDVKPANILLGRGGSIKVTDFGIAELLSSMSPTQDVVFGTPGYLPPETLQGQGYDRSSDLFSLGAILYFCLTGRRPFEGRSVREVIRKTMFSSVTPPRELVPSVPPDLEALVLELLAADRSRRPGDAGEVAARLERMAGRAGASWSLPEGPFDADAAREAPDETDGARFVATTRVA